MSRRLSTIRKIKSVFTVEQLLAIDKWQHNLTPSPSCVYFISGSNLVKIGTSTNVIDRYMAMANFCPVPLTLTAIIPGNITRERELHREWKHRRWHGEWFALTKEEVAEEQRINWYPRVLLDQYGRLRDFEEIAA